MLHPNFSFHLSSLTKNRYMVTQTEIHLQFTYVNSYIPNYYHKLTISKPTDYKGIHEKAFSNLLKNYTSAVQTFQIESRSNAVLHLHPFKIT